LKQLLAYGLRSFLFYVIPTLHYSYEESYPGPPIRVIAQKEGHMCPLPLDETERHITWTWCLKHLVINLVLGLLLFGLLFLIASYMQYGMSSFVEQ